MTLFARVRVWWLRHVLRRRVYIPPDVRHYYWLPAIADPSAPTRSEFDVGTDLTGDIFSVWGLSPGTAEAEIEMYGPGLPLKISGYVAVLPEGDAPGRLAELYPALVEARSDRSGVAGTVVHLAVTGMPHGVKVP